MSMFQAVDSVFSNYCKFSGRSRRSEYWYFTLFNLLITGFMSARAGSSPYMAQILSVYSLAVMIPGLAVTVRRLHDTGRSGWRCLLYLVPFGAFFLLVWLAKDSTPGANRYGVNPKYPSWNDARC